MNSRSGLSFADVLIIIAVVLLLAALSVPKFVKAPDYGTEEDDTGATNETAAVGQPTNAPAASTELRPLVPPRATAP